MDKKEAYDLDKVRVEMEAAMPDSFEPPDPATDMPDATGDAAPGDGSNAPATEDDPLKALQDSLEKKPKK